MPAPPHSTLAASPWPQATCHEHDDGVHTVIDFKHEGCVLQANASPASGCFVDSRNVPKKLQMTPECVRKELECPEEECSPEETPDARIDIANYWEGNIGECLHLSLTSLHPLVAVSENGCHLLLLSTPPRTNPYYVDSQRTRIVDVAHPPSWLCI